MGSNNYNVKMWKKLYSEIILLLDTTASTSKSKISICFALAKLGQLQAISDKYAERFRSDIGHY